MKGFVNTLVVIDMGMAEDALGAWTDVVVRVVGEVVDDT
jgi:hypothetical protein